MVSGARGGCGQKASRVGHGSSNHSRARVLLFLLLILEASSAGVPCNFSFHGPPRTGRIADDDSRVEHERDGHGIRAGTTRIESVGRPVCIGGSGAERTYDASGGNVFGTEVHNSGVRAHLESWRDAIRSYKLLGQSRRLRTAGRARVRRDGREPLAT